MAGWRRVVELAMTNEEVARMTAVSHSRTEPASRVERARMLLGYRETPSFFAVAQRLGARITRRSIQPLANGRRELGGRRPPSNDTTATGGVLSSIVALEKEAPPPNAVETGIPPSTGPRRCAPV